MKAKDELTDLFARRLTDARLTVREGFWEELHDSIEAPATGRRLSSTHLHRWMAAATVALLIGVASAAWWHFSPKEEIKDAFTQVAVSSPQAVLQGDRVQETLPSPYSATPTHPAAVNTLSCGSSLLQPASLTQEEEEEMVSVRVSITIQQRMYGNGRAENLPAKQTGSSEFLSSDETSAETSSASDVKPDKGKEGRWSMKASLGSSLSKGDYDMPLTASLSLERRLTDRLSLETGVQYHRLSGAGETLHALAVPVKLNVLLADGNKLDLYATAGAAAEKCIAGAPDNDFSADPVRLSVSAGVGVRYRLNDRLALFAEPSLSHHFDTDSEARSLRTERPTNLNLLCGLRVTY